MFSCANNIVMKLPVPKSADNVSHRITSGTQTAEFKSSEKAWYWTIAKLQGGSEISANIKVNMKKAGALTMQHYFIIYDTETMSVFSWVIK